MDLFLARFTLSDEEANALSSSAKTVPPKPGASSNLPALLSLKWNDYRLDIMAVTASHLERAYDKLVRWCRVPRYGPRCVVRSIHRAKRIRTAPPLACVAPFAGGTSRVSKLPPAYLACIAADACLATRLTNTRLFRNKV